MKHAPALAAFAVAEMTGIPLLIWLAVATASLSYTITKTTMFDWLRDMLEPENPLWKLLSCPYCMSHWIGALFVLVYLPEPFGLDLVDLIPSLFIIVTISAFLIQALTIFGRIASYLRKFEGNNGNAQS